MTPWSEEQSIQYASRLRLLVPSMMHSPLFTLQFHSSYEAGAVYEYSTSPTFSRILCSTQLSQSQHDSKAWISVQACLHKHSSAHPSTNPAYKN